MEFANKTLDPRHYRELRQVCVHHKAKKSYTSIQFMGRSIYCKDMHYKGIEVCCRTRLKVHTTQPPSLPPSWIPQDSLCLVVVEGKGTSAVPYSWHPLYWQAFLAEAGQPLWLLHPQLESIQKISGCDVLSNGKSIDSHTP